MSLNDLKAALSEASNLSQFKGLSAAYGTLLSGIPSLDGYANLIATNNSTNFGAGPGPVFNDENIIINTLNALYQGNSTAKTAFNAILADVNAGGDLLTAVYNYVIPAASRTQAGLDYFKSQSGFYTARAAELGIPGETGAAVVAFASLTKIAVDNGIKGLGDTLNDLISAVNNGSAVIPQGGTLFTSLETADGTQFDADDVPGAGSGPVYSISVSPSAVAEGNTGSGNQITYTVSRTGDVTKAGSVAVLIYGSAGAGDYTTDLSGNVVSFAAGHDQVTFTVTSTPDTIQEGDETVFAALGQITGGGTVGTNSIVVGTIVNDDGSSTGPVYSISVSPTSVQEGNSGGGNQVTFTVTRTGDISKAGSVAVALSGDAGANDYSTTLSGGVVSFAAGHDQVTFTVTTTPDTVVEPDEAVIANLGAITGGGTLFTGKTNATAVIVNDDSGSNQGLVQAANSQVITGTTNPDVLTVTALAPSVTSDLLGGENTVLLSNGVNISAATYNATGGYVIYKIADGGSVTMSQSQNERLAEAPGVNTVTITSSGEITGNSQVENYKLSGGNDAFVMSLPASGDHYVDIASGGSDIIRFFNYTFSPTDTGILVVTGFDVANDKFASKNFSSRYGEISHSFGETVTLSNQAMGATGNGNLERTIYEIETSSAGALTGATIRATANGGPVATLIANAIGPNLTSDPSTQTLNTAIIYVTGIGAAIYQFEVKKSAQSVDLTVDTIAGVELIGVLAGVAENSLTSANYSL